MKDNSGTPSTFERNDPSKMRMVVTITQIQNQRPVGDRRRIRSSCGTKGTYFELRERAELAIISPRFDITSIVHPHGLPKVSTRLRPQHAVGNRVYAPEVFYGSPNLMKQPLYRAELPRTVFAA